MWIRGEEGDDKRTKGKRGKLKSEEEERREGNGRGKEKERGGKWRRGGVRGQRGR